MAEILSAVNVHKTYLYGGNKINALKGVSLDITPGEFIGVVGPSGAGKSTLLHVLGGLDRPTRGAVYFKKHDIYKFSDGERSYFRSSKVGFIFQFYNLLPEFTVLENVMMPAFIKSGIVIKNRSVREKALRLLDSVGLSHRTTHKPLKLSGGEAQRVAIARALINDPEVILCDEPTGNLDSAMSEQIYGIIYEICRSCETSVIVVTHQKEYLKKFDRVLTMKDGVIAG